MTTRRKQSRTVSPNKKRAQVINYMNLRVTGLRNFLRIDLRLLSDMTRSARHKDEFTKTMLEAYSELDRLELSRKKLKGLVKKLSEISQKETQGAER